MLNRKQVSETKITFQDFATSSIALEVGSAIEVNNRGPWSVKRFEVTSKNLSACGTMHDFEAVAV